MISTCLGLIQHVHNVSDGGLAVYLAESAIHADGLGFDVTLPPRNGARLDAVLFVEAQSRMVLSTKRHLLAEHDRNPRRCRGVTK